MTIHTAAKIAAPSIQATITKLTSSSVLLLKDHLDDHGYDGCNDQYLQHKIIKSHPEESPEACPLEWRLGIGSEACHSLALISHEQTSGRVGVKTSSETFNS